MDICRNLSLIGLSVFIIHSTSKIKYIGTFLTTLFSTFILLILFDSFFMFKLKGPSLTSSSGSPPVSAQAETKPKSFSEVTQPSLTYINDDEYGFFNRKNETVTSTVTVNGEQLPEIFYVFDDFGRRIDRSASSDEKKKYALFFGCSITLGQHVPESKTLPAWFERKNVEYHSYNYGVSASGPNHYLAMLQNMDIRSQVEESDGIFIYSFFDGHINRAISDFQTYKWNNATPYYYLDNEKVLRKGSFNSGRFWQSLLFDILNKSYFTEYIKFNYPKSIGDRELEFTARLIDEMRNEYIRQFGNDKFYVLLLPGFDNSIIPYLEKYNVNYIDESDLIEDYWKSEYIFPIDTHPTGELYDSLSKALTKELNIGASDSTVSDF